MDTLTLTGKRVFVVEDDPTNMAVFAVILKGQGANVIQDFWHGGTLGMIRQFMPVDIILMDLMLRHGVSGYDIFQQIQRESDLAYIPVVAVSASDPAIEVPRAQQLGFSGFISKPISLHDFPTQIARCINGEKLWLTHQA